MTTETNLTVYKSDISVIELRQFAMDFAKSGYFQDARDVAQAVVKIQAGRELGFSPVYSMTKIYIVKGKVAVSAETMGAMIKRTNRYDYHIKKLDDTECILEFTDSGKLTYTSTFNMKDAARAELVKSDSGWVKWPRAMLMSKALSQGARIVCPHVISGTYTPEEFGMEPNESGEYKEPFVEPVQVRQDKEDVIPVEPLPNVQPLEPMATDAQRRKIFAEGKHMGYNEDEIKALIKARSGKEKTSELTQKEVSEIIDSIERGDPV
jgi:hypothetical protein